MTTTPCVTGALSNAVGFRDWKKHVPLSASLCEPPSRFIFIWVRTEFIKIGTFCLICPSWVLGFQLVCPNCAIFFASSCFMRFIYVFVVGEGFLFVLMWVWWTMGQYGVFCVKSPFFVKNETILKLCNWILGLFWCE